MREQIAGKGVVYRTQTDKDRKFMSNLTKEKLNHYGVHVLSMSIPNLFKIAEGYRRRALSLLEGSGLNVNQK